MDDNNPLLDSIRSKDGKLKLGEFYALPETSKFFYAPTRALWPADGVNILPQVPTGEFHNGALVTIKASTWLKQFRRAEQMTWAPGEPEIIRDRLISEGGWSGHVGACCLNLYKPPPPIIGDPTEAGPWIDHLRALYPDDADHFCDWGAFQVQQPGEKVNHALLMGGPPGIGKDTILAPIRLAVGAWNFKDISPDDLAAPFNPHVKAKILRISEARDLGDGGRFDKFALYEKTKILAAAPPEVLRCNDKNIPAFYLPNVPGLIATTNHRTDGYYLPSDDRRWYVMWSLRVAAEFGEAYFRRLWAYLEDGGHRHVAAFLMARDLSNFDPKAPPKRTEAFFAIVNAGRAPEDNDLEAVLDELGRPEVCSLLTIRPRRGATMEWLLDRRARRAMPHRMARCGYIACRNPDSEQGLWSIAGRKFMLYARDDLSRAAQVKAAEDFVLANTKTTGKA